MNENEQFVFASSVIGKTCGEQKNNKKSATVKKQFIISGEYHETYY